MSTASTRTCAPPRSTATPLPWSAVGARFADYLELTKPRIAVMVLLTVTMGYTLNSGAPWNVAVLLHALAGIALVASSSSALNQWLERHTDALMTRTADRPLPAGRLSPREVLAFGIATGVAGTVYLAVAVNLLTAALTAATLVLYVAAYTPLKRTTSFCTAVGAIPGALPPVLGWTAASGTLDGGAIALFGILYLWQFPHFLAIAWIYREQYADAGLRMLPAVRPAVGVTGWMSVGYALALLPVSLLPYQMDLAGSLYFAIAASLGVGYLVAAVQFARRESRDSARGLLLTSLLYLPLLLGVLVWDHLRLLS